MTNNSQLFQSTADKAAMTATNLASSINSLNLNARSGGAFQTSSNTAFSTRLKNGIANGANLAYQSVAPAAPYVPGAAVMSAMLGNTAAALSGEGVARASTAPMAGGFGPGFMPGNASVPATGNGNMVQSMEQMQQNMMSSNLYMLNLQQRFSDMTQQYTAISNILKTKHDTERTITSNFRA
ncbi:MAG: hypothetical protein JKY15_06970 [Deltaproteobacteria bacterium]|nr:hypothetical protein [Deltaproteobacteria bacterium]